MPDAPEKMISRLKWLVWCDIPREKKAKARRLPPTCPVRPLAKVRRFSGVGKRAKPAFAECLKSLKSLKGFEGFEGFEGLKSIKKI